MARTVRQLVAALAFGCSLGLCAGVARAELAARVVDASDVGPRWRAPDGGQLFGVLVRSQDAAAAAFGRTVDFREPPRPAPQNVGFERSGKRRAGAEFGAK